MIRNTWKHCQTEFLKTSHCRQATQQAEREDFHSSAFYHIVHSIARDGLGSERDFNTKEPKKPLCLCHCILVVYIENRRKFHSFGSKKFFSFLSEIRWFYLGPSFKVTYYAKPGARMSHINGDRRLLSWSCSQLQLSMVVFCRMSWLHWVLLQFKTSFKVMA